MPVVTTDTVIKVLIAELRAKIHSVLVALRVDTTVVSRLRPEGFVDQRSE